MIFGSRFVVVFYNCFLYSKVCRRVCKAFCDNLHYTSLHGFLSYDANWRSFHFSYGYCFVIRFNLSHNFEIFLRPQAQTKGAISNRKWLSQIANKSEPIIAVIPSNTQTVPLLFPFYPNRTNKLTKHLNLGVIVNDMFTYLLLATW